MKNYFNNNLNPQKNFNQRKYYSPYDIFMYFYLPIIEYIF